MRLLDATRDARCDLGARHRAIAREDIRRIIDIQLAALQQSLEAAARARSIRFGPATIETSLPGVLIDIVPEPKQT